MKKLIGIGALAVGLSATGAFAQTTTDAPTPRQAPPEIQADAPPPPVPRDADGDRSKSEWRMGATADRPSAPDRGARFRVEDGDTKIDIRCAEDQPTKECSDLLLQVLDRLQAGGSSEDTGSRGDYDRGRPRFR
jgi:hypothetical protein